MEKNTKPKIVAVEWIDAESHDPWEDITDLDIEFPIIISVGVFLGENENGILIAGNYDAKNEQASCTMKIPHGMIRDFKVLKY